MSLSLELRQYTLHCAEWAVSSDPAKKLAQDHCAPFPCADLQRKCAAVQDMYAKGFTTAEIKDVCKDQGWEQLSTRADVCIFFDATVNQIGAIQNNGESQIYDAHKLLFACTQNEFEQSGTHSRTQSDPLLALQQAASSNTKETCKRSASPSSAPAHEEPPSKRPAPDEDLHETDRRKSPDSVDDDA